MTKKQKLENNIKKVYLYQILGGIFFSIPVIVLFWQENGLSLTEIMVLQSIYAILAALLEVPTGYFADVYGRVPSLVIATVTSFFAIVVYSLGHNFAQFLVAEIFFAFAVSFASGTLSAFVYDTLKDLGREKEYKKIWGNMLSFGLVSLAISGIIGGFIGKIDLRYTMYLSIPFFAFMIPVVLSMQEPKRHKLIFKEGYLKQMFRVVYENIAKNQKLKWIIIYSGVIFAFNQSALWLYQPYLKLTGVDVVYFGIVFACFSIVSALSSKYAYRLEKKLGQKYSLVMLIFLISGSYFLMSNFIFLFSFSFVFIQQFVRGFKNSVVTGYINDLTSSSVRATVLSVESFLSRMVYAMIIPIIGWIADVYSLQEALIVMGATTAMIGLLILYAFRRYEVL